MFKIFDKQLFMKVKGRITYYYSHETIIVVVISNHKLTLPVVHVNLQNYDTTTSSHRNLVLEEYKNNPQIKYETEEQFNSLLQAIKF